MSRKDKIATSITDAVIHPHDRLQRRRWRKVLRALFTLYGIQLFQYAGDEFAQLRHLWHIDNQSYLNSFEPHDSKSRTALQTKGTMGYSGSTFFNTSDGKYLVKSVPRHFEHSFFKEDFLQVYVDHMTHHMESFLIRIVDFLAVENDYNHSPGVILGCAPSHHILMENLLVGRDEGQENGKKLLKQSRHKNLSGLPQHQADEHKDNDDLWKWQTWDLKPTSYFFPERDIAEGRLTSEATKSRLADKFEDKLILTQKDADKFLSQLKTDTLVLQKANAVDYSLFLIRIPVIEPSDESQVSQSNENPFNTPEENAEQDISHTTAGPDLATTAPTPSQPPFTPPSPPSWRTGIRSADGKYVYRAAVLDFFWAKHKAHPKMMTRLVNTWNKIDPGGSKGPMSITTDSKEYRERFLSMCEGFVEIPAEEGTT